LKKVLITRQPNQSQEFINLLSKSNHFPFLLPMIETLSVKFDSEKKEYDYIVFSSVNAVRYFIESFNEYNFNKIIAIGETTAKYLEQFEIIPDLVPYEYSSEGLIEELKDKDLKNKSFFIPGPKKKSDRLSNFLLKKEAIVDEIVIYETKPVIYKSNYIDEFIKENNINFITFTSPSSAESFLSQINTLPSNISFISIGKITYEFLRERRIDSYYPTKYTIKEMVNLINKL
jgi:uroporphyrinogen-III synthase